MPRQNGRSQPPPPQTRSSPASSPHRCVILLPNQNRVLSRESSTPPRSLAQNSRSCCLQFGKKEAKEVGLQQHRSRSVLIDIPDLHLPSCSRIIAPSSVPLSQPEAAEETHRSRPVRGRPHQRTCLHGTSGRRPNPAHAVNRTNLLRLSGSLAPSGVGTQSPELTRLVWTPSSRDWA